MGERREGRKQGRRKGRQEGGVVKPCPKGSCPLCHTTKGLPVATKPAGCGHQASWVWSHTKCLLPDVRVDIDCVAHFEMDAQGNAGALPIHKLRDLMADVAYGVWQFS